MDVHTFVPSACFTDCRKEGLQGDVDRLCTLTKGVAAKYPASAVLSVHNTAQSAKLERCATNLGKMLDAITGMSCRGMESGQDTLPPSRFFLGKIVPCSRQL